MEYGCIGEKLSHSFSKIIHNKLCDYDYELKEISRDELADFMKKADFKAINVTIPYKQDVIPFLDEISDIAKKIGAVNTIVKRNGKLLGFNTDFSGMTDLINKNNIAVKDKKVLILGGGGTCKTAFAVAHSMGAKEVLRVSRSKKTGFITYAEAVKLHNDAQIIINTTPCGMYPEIGMSPIDVNKFPDLQGVVDAVYNPLCSQLVVDAQKKRIPAVGGLYMLVAQAVFAVEKFLQINIPQEKTKQVFGEILLSKRNLVLVGMPGCGKTTIGTETAKILGKEFVDTDLEIVKREGITIPEIFSLKGEEYFRRVESEVVAEISKKQGLVIATGGGAVLNSRNVDLLKGNGTVVFIDRPIEELVTTSDRPLSSNRELLEKRYNERYDIYCNSAHYRIDAKYDLQKNIQAVKEAFLNENFSN